MFKFFNENNLISPKQSGFKPGDSCINQLISVPESLLLIKLRATSGWLILVFAIKKKRKLDTKFFYLFSFD